MKKWIDTSISFMLRDVSDKIKKELNWKRFSKKRLELLEEELLNSAGLYEYEILDSAIEQLKNQTVTKKEV